MSSFGGAEATEMPHWPLPPPTDEWPPPATAKYGMIGSGLRTEGAIDTMSAGKARSQVHKLCFEWSN
jgi:hypothetical protein